MPDHHRLSRLLQCPQKPQGQVLCRAAHADAGALGLPQAACKRFQEVCQEKGIQLGSKGFTMAYDTNIPRQTGLSGSSGIVCAGVQQPEKAVPDSHMLYALQLTAS